jgi:hypothetical protein
MQLSPVPLLLVLCLVFQTKRAWQSGSKHLKRWYRGKLHQTMIDSWCCLNRFVPEKMSQVLRRSEVGNHKRHTLNTQLFSGTSAETFACPAGPYRNCTGEEGAKNEPNMCTRSKKKVPNSSDKSFNWSSGFISSNVQNNEEERQEAMSFFLSFSWVSMTHLCHSRLKKIAVKRRCTRSYFQTSPRMHISVWWIETGRKMSAGHEQSAITSWEAFGMKMIPGDWHSINLPPPLPAHPPLTPHAQSSTSFAVFDSLCKFFEFCVKSSDTWHLSGCHRQGGRTAAVPRVGNVWIQQHPKLKYVLETAADANSFV